MFGRESGSRGSGFKPSTTDGINTLRTAYEISRFVKIERDTKQRVQWLYKSERKNPPFARCMSKQEDSDGIVGRFIRGSRWIILFRYFQGNSYSGEVLAMFRETYDNEAGKIGQEFLRGLCKEESSFYKFTSKRVAIKIFHDS